MTAPLDIAQGYLARGWLPVPIAYREKGPKLRGWQNLRLTAPELPKYFNGQPANIGILLGEPSGGLADVDLDCEETVRLARSLLPETMAFGRRGKRRSHLLFNSPGATTEKFCDPRDNQTLVELRSTGGQTVFPGSTHPSGELVEWEPGPDLPLPMSPVDLRALVAKLAVAALIARRAPEQLDDFLSVGALSGLPADIAAKAQDWLRLHPEPAPAPPVIRSARAAERFEEALERFNADHTKDWGRPGSGECPACGHKGCFGRMKDSQVRWACFSAGHPDECGTAGEKCHTGDALDLESFLAGRSPADHLRSEGYLAAAPSQPRWEEPPPPTDADAPPFMDRDSDTGPVSPEPPPPGDAPAVAPHQHPRQAVLPIHVEPAEWPDPEPLDVELLPVQPFTPDLLPEALRPWLMDCANRAQTPLEFVAVPAVVALGSIIGRQLALRPLEKDDWQEFANLWGVLIGPPSEMKSQAMSSGLAPLERLAHKAIQEHDAEMEVFNKDFAAAKAKADALKKAMAKAAAAGDDLSYLQSQVKPLPEPPPGRRFKVTDSTPEKLADLLVKNPNGLALVVDELAGWLHGLERDGHEQERSFYLTGWSGKSSYDIDRVSRGTLHIPAICLSIIGTIQPGVWSNYVREALGSRAGADGFLQRFQLAIWPDPLKHTRVVDQFPDRQAKDRACALFELLAHVDVEALGAHKGEFDKVPFLRFDEEAQPVAKQALEQHRSRWRHSTDHPALTAHMIKAQKTWAALCLIFHVVEWAAGGKGGDVGTNALSMALGWLDYLESQARRIYGCGLSKDKSALQVLSAKLASGELKSGFTARELTRKHWAGLSEQDQVEAVLQTLQVAGWVRTARVKTKGRPRVAFLVNPKVAGAGEACDRSAQSRAFATPSVKNASDEWLSVNSST